MFEWWHLFLHDTFTFGMSVFLFVSIGILGVIAYEGSKL